MPEVLVFDPIDYDAEEIPPDAPAGAWQATCSVKPQKTSAGIPSLVVEWTLTAAYNEQNEAFVGQSVSDWITLMPGVSTGAKRSKIRLKAFAEKIGVSRQLLPKHIASSEDLMDFCNACEGIAADIWTYIGKRKDKQTGQETDQTQVAYAEPKSGAVANGVMGGEALEATEATALEGEEPAEAAFTGDEPEAPAEEEVNPEAVEPDPTPAPRGRKPRAAAVQPAQAAPTPATRSPAPAQRPVAQAAPATRQPVPATRPTAQPANANGANGTPARRPVPQQPQARR